MLVSRFERCILVKTYGSPEALVHDIVILVPDSGDEGAALMESDRTLVTAIARAILNTGLVPFVNIEYKPTKFW
jgi:hypothetical protein